MTDRVTELPDRARIAEEAAAWVARLDAGPLAADDLKELRAWSEQSPRHRSALEEMAEQWDSLDVLAVYQGRMDAPVRSSGRRHTLFAALAAGVAGLAVALWFIAAPSRDDLTSQNIAHATAVGERRDITLIDGTVLQVNTDSHLRVAYGKERRIVRLYRGEVFFDVAAAADWPFEVDTGNATVAAVGTAFAVRIEVDNAVEVNVTEGRVRVSAHVVPSDTGASGARPNAYTTELEAAQRLRFDQVIESVQTLEPAELEQDLSWRDGMLVFDREPLPQVVAEISRYTPIDIVVADPVLRQLEFGGYFPTGDVEALLSTLEGSFGIHVDRDESGVVYLRAAVP